MFRFTGTLAKSSIHLLNILHFRSLLPPQNNDWQNTIKRLKTKLLCIIHYLLSIILPKGDILAVL